MNKRYTLAALLLLIGVGLVMAKDKRGESPMNPAVKADEVRMSVAQDTVRYLPYSEPNFNAVKHQKRVLFFRAAWCGSCQDAEAELSKVTADIPTDVTVFDVNFDTAVELKRKYDVVVQHTFVQVDSQGNVITTWVGGGVDQLREKLL